MKIKDPESSPKSRPWLIILGIIGMIALGSFLIPRSAPSESFEILLTEGQPEIYSHAAQSWIPAKEGKAIGVHEKIRTPAGSQIDMAIPGKIYVRLKENSQIENRGASSGLSGAFAHIHLVQGTVLGSTGKELEKGRKIEISTPVSVAAVRGTLFRIEHNPESNKTWVGALQGGVEVRISQIMAFQRVHLNSLEKVEIQKGKGLSKPDRISRKEWGEMKDAYELIPKTAEFEEQQKDLSKEAGSLFYHVFDHGTFYVPEYGYADREFFFDGGANGVFLNIAYDVFPAGSFSGMYIKTRNLDLSRFETFEFEVRRAPDEDYPEAIRIEFKSKGQTIRAFASKVFKKQWRVEQLKLNVNRPTPIDEVTLVFAHDRVGEHKKGTVQLRKINLIPKSEGEAPAPIIAEKIE